ncbi:MAG: glycogen/starch synthase, partial [Planctomycetota bacterium]
MDITFVTTEAVPFAKTGGLADVCGTLPQCLADRGHTVNVIMPAFRQVFECGQQIESTGIEFSVNLRGSEMHGNVLQSQLPIAQAESSAASAGGRGRRPRVPVYLI